MAHQRERSWKGGTVIVAENGYPQQTDKTYALGHTATTARVGSQSAPMTASLSLASRSTSARRWRVHPGCEQPASARS